MFCKNCGKEMNDNQAICLNCGVKTGNGNAFCQNCGKSVDPNAAICISCGVALKKDFFDPDNTLGGQSKWIVALVCLFVGYLGIHNFIMGETKKGIFKIIMTFLCCIGSILALIDLIKILMDKYVVDPTKLV